MKKYVTMKDVANHAGTSIATVSYVISNKKGRYITPDTREKVLNAIKELNYVKCAGASVLKGKQRKLVAILVPQFANQFFNRIITSAGEVFAKHGYDMIICDTFDDPEREKSIIYRMMSQRVDGIIIAPTCDGNENTKALRDVGIKMVAVDRSLNTDSEYTSVVTSNYKCGYLAAEHLVKNGHRKIGFIGWETSSLDLKERENAVRDVIDNTPGATLYASIGELDTTNGDELTKKLLSEHSGITAIIYGFNMQAGSGVIYLRDNGYRIPEDISIVLIGSPEWAYTGYTKYTYVDMGDFELGHNAAECLIGLLNGSQNEGLHLIQDCKLIINNSTKNMEER